MRAPPPTVVASLCRCKFAPRLGSRGLSLCGGYLLRDRVVGFVVSDAVEPLAVELGEPDAVGLVGDEEIEDGPDQREAAFLAGEAADHLRAPLDLTERPLEQVRASPPATMSGWVAQVHDERVQVVGQAFGRGDKAALVEVVDQRLQALLGVVLVDGVIERLPVGVLDAFALAFGQLGV